MIIWRGWDKVAANQIPSCVPRSRCMSGVLGLAGVGPINNALSTQWRIPPLLKWGRHNIDVKAARGLAGLQAINRIPPMKITDATETHTWYHLWLHCIASIHLPNLSKWKFRIKTSCSFLILDKIHVLFAEIARKEQWSSLISLKLKILKWVPPNPPPQASDSSLGTKGGWGEQHSLAFEREWGDPIRTTMYSVVHSISKNSDYDCKKILASRTVKKSTTVYTRQCEWILDIYMKSIKLTAQASHIVRYSGSTFCSFRRKTSEIFLLEV